MNQMTQKQFESEVVRLFPELAEEVQDYAGLLHPIYGALYRHAQVIIAREDWADANRLFRFVEESLDLPDPPADIENCVRVSFLEYFEFGEHESIIRKLLGPRLVQLYEDQMMYMENLQRS
jgi:hypothetical protein